MKARLTITVGDYERFIIARYFRLPNGKRRTRATRMQVKRFVLAALRSAVREQAEDILDARGKAMAQRLQTPTDDAPGVEFLTEPREKQRSLTW